MGIMSRGSGGRTGTASEMSDWDRRPSDRERGRQREREFDRMERRKRYGRIGLNFMAVCDLVVFAGERKMAHLSSVRVGAGVAMERCY